MGKGTKLIKCISSYLGLKVYLFKTKRMNIEQGDDIVLLNTEKGSDNLGDTIIMAHCREVLSEILPERHYVEIASHNEASPAEINAMLKAKAVIVCGTNFLAPRMELHTVWNYSKKMVRIPNILLLAVGGVRKPYSLYETIL